MVIIRNNKTPLKHLKSIMFESDISLSVLFTGTSLIYLGVLSIIYGLNDYNLTFTILNYLITGSLLGVIIVLQYPITLSLLTGTWCSIIWTWTIVQNISNNKGIDICDTHYIWYVIVGLLIIQRTSRLKYED